MPTTVTTAGGGSITTHSINFKGISGAIFWCILICFVLYVVGFATEGWATSGSSHQVGLWRTCSCTSGSLQGQSWFKGAQAVFTIGLIFMCLAVFLGIAYMAIHVFSKNTVLIMLTVCCFVAFLFIFIGLCIFGAEMAKISNYNVNYSYAFAVITTIGCLVAGILCVVQMRQSDMI